MKKYRSLPHSVTKKISSFLVGHVLASKSLEFRSRLLKIARRMMDSNSLSKLLPLVEDFHTLKDQREGKVEEYVEVILEIYDHAPKIWFDGKDPKPIQVFCEILKSKPGKTSKRV
jgi:hypothetical protein